MLPECPTAAFEEGLPVAADPIADVAAVNWKRRSDQHPCCVAGQKYFIYLMTSDGEG